MKVKFFNRKNATLTASALALVLVSASSMAGIVTDWTYSTDATFTASSYTSGGSGTTSTSPYELSWGATGGDFTDTGADPADARSALTIGNGALAVPTKTGGGPATGTVKTGIVGDAIGPGEVGIGVNFTHWNNEILSVFDTLTGGTIHDTLTLTPLLPAVGAPVDAPEIDFMFTFVETPNGGPCAGGTSTPCGDLFGFFGISTTSLPFMYDGVQYFASVLVTDEFGGAAPIGTLLDAQCDQLGLAHGCQGFLTPEEAVTTVQFAFIVQTVPEPATLAIMGLGLAGLGFRRFKAKIA